MEIRIKGIDLEVEYIYYEEELSTIDHPGSADEVELTDATYKGISIIDILDEWALWDMVEGSILEKIKNGEVR